MILRARTLFLIFVCLLGMWFFYAERAILTPFIVAAIFAYLFNPIVSFLTTRLKIPRTISIILIYSILTFILVFGSFLLYSRIIDESSELRMFITRSLQNTQSEVKNFPAWLQPTARDLLDTFKHSRFLGFISGESFLPVFSQAISRVLSFFIFLFSAFYFLKDGDMVFQKILAKTPGKYKIDIEILFRKINLILGGYLRGQIFLVFLMSILTYIALLVLGIRFAFLIALFSGFAEIVPVIGPIVAASVAILMVFFTGTVNFGLTPFQGAIAIAIIYFTLRQLEDYFVMPYVFGKITKLPAFIIFFAVVAGGHIGGVLGLILAVPVAAILRLFLEFFLSR